MKMKKIKVDFSLFCNDEQKKPRPRTVDIASTLYEEYLGGNPIYLDEETKIIYAPICTRDHFEKFYGNVKIQEENNG